MRNLVGRHWPWLVLVVASYALAAARPWIDPDEGRYAEIPREMLVTGDWVTPHLNGLLYLEKPPLQYWATAIAYRIFGVNEFGSRLYSLTLTLLSIPLAFVAARKLFGDDASGHAAAVALAASPYFLLIAHLNLLDGAFAAWLAAALVAFVQAQTSADARQARNFMLLTWTAVAAALLQKGIVVGVLCGATLVAYTALTRDLSVWRRLYLLPGLAILLAITSGWFVLVSQRNPGFLRFFFIHEHFQRFLTTVHKHGEPWWYFIPLVVFAVIPWLGQVTPSLRQAWSQRLQPAGFRPRLFLLLWCAVVLVFFSASGSKLATYIMPCVPFLAVLLAPRIAASETAMPRAVHATGGLLLVAATVIVVIAQRRSDRLLPGQVALWCGVAAFAAVAGIVATLAMRRRGRPGAAWKPLVASAAVGWSSLLMAYTATPPLRTAAALARTVRGHIGPQTALYSVGQYRPSLAPYLGRTLRVADYRGEFEGGLDSDSPSGLLTLEAFEQEWSRESDGIAFLSHRAYANLAAKGLTGRVIASDDRSIVIERK